MPPSVTPQEGNIIVYLAGYVGRKAVVKFKCKDCTAVWKKHDEASHSALYTFINNKQYDDLTVGRGGLFYPSTVLVDFITCLESVFREQVPLAIHRPKIGLHFMSKVKGEGCLQHFQHNMFEHCVHIGAILYGAIVLYCQDSPFSS